jgi:hypothetical protein
MNQITGYWRKIMRWTFFILFAGIMVASCATSGAKVTEPITYAEVVEVADLSQDTLYTRANMWFVDAFRSAESVIQFSDKTSGIIKGKYIGDNVMAGVYVCKISSTVTVEVKEGRYRISFTDPFYQYIGDVLSGIYTKPGVEGPVVTVEMGNKVKEEWVNLAASLKTSITTEASSW